MSAARVEYTSCPDGMDGIGGFQVRASTPSVARELLEEALAAAVFEPSYDLPNSPDEVALADFPVSFGLVMSHQGAAVYRSNYVGRDYTGRWGNYFAQVLVFDTLDALDGLLPIDLWESPLWRTRSEAVGTLPPLDVVQADAGPLTEGATAEFLRRPGRTERLAGLLASVRQVLSGGERLVVVVEDSNTAAQWLSALSRSLPRASALRLTFTTWTSRPQAHRADVTFVTPGVSVPSYGAFRALDVTSAATPAGSGVSDYDRIVAASWDEDGPAVLLQMMNDKRLPDTEFDAVARLAVFAGLLPGTLPAEEMAVLQGLLEVERLTPEWARAAWWEAGQLVAQERLRLSDPSSWGAVMSRTPTARVPQALIAAYLDLAVRHLVAGTQHDLWLPPLDEASTKALARDSVAPALVGGDRPDVARWLTQRADPALRDAVLAVLEAALARVTQLQEAASLLPLPAAQFVTDHPASSERLALFADFVTVRQGAGDALGLLTSPVLVRSLTRPEDWAALPAQLWPEAPPSAAVCLRLLRELPSWTVEHTKLIDLALDRLAAETSTADIGEEVLQLSHAVVQRNGDVGGADVGVALLIQGCAYFEAASTEPLMRATPQLDSVLITAPAASLALRERAWTAVTEWSLHHPEAWIDVLRKAQRSSTWSEFLEHFCAQAPREISRLPPASIAGLVAVWLDAPSGTALATGRLSERLLHEVLPQGLERTSRKALDAVGNSLPGAADRILGRGIQPDGGWPEWWRRWRARHEAQGLVARLRRRVGDR